MPETSQRKLVARSGHLDIHPFLQREECNRSPDHRSWPMEAALKLPEEWVWVLPGAGTKLMDSWHQSEPRLMAADSPATEWDFEKGVHLLWEVRTLSGEWFELVGQGREQCIQSHSRLLATDPELVLHQC